MCSGRNGRGLLTVPLLGSVLNRTKSLMFFFVVLSRLGILLSHAELCDSTDLSLLTPYTYNTTYGSLAASGKLCGHLSKFYSYASENVKKCSKIIYRRASIKMEKNIIDLIYYGTTLGHT